MTNAPTTPWLAAHEGYYGPPLSHPRRCELVTWLAANGYDGYVYAPKSDPLHRDHWRRPYPATELAEFEHLHETCRSVGIELVVSLSPGHGWTGADEDVADAAAKLAPFAAMGIDRFGIQWDDLFEGGAEVGRRHGEGVARIRERLGAGTHWVAAPDDYALALPSEYLRAFAGSLPADVTITWTGPSVVSRALTLEALSAFESGLGRTVVFAENFPVNDLAMADVLHLGPYPHRDPRLVDHLVEVYVNFMERPLASRIGLGVAADFWKRSSAGRESDWKRRVDQVGGLEPIARACRSWLGEPEPDPWLLEALDGATRGRQDLRQHLARGCREGLLPDWEAELLPWLVQWEAEASAMTAALEVLDAANSGEASVRAVWRAAEAWRTAQRASAQVFGIRMARYPVTHHDGRRMVATHGCVVTNRNLTDRLWELIDLALTKNAPMSS